MQHLTLPKDAVSVVSVDHRVTRIEFFQRKEEARSGRENSFSPVELDLSDYFEIILARSVPKRGNSKRIFEGLEGRSDGATRTYRHFGTVCKRCAQAAQAYRSYPEFPTVPP